MGAHCGLRQLLLEAAGHCVFSPRSWNFHPDSSSPITHNGSQRSQGEEVGAVMPYACIEMTFALLSCAMEDSKSFHFLNKTIQTNFC